MRKPTDWTGIKLHHLTFKKPSDKQTKGRIKWDLECDCGKIISVFPGNVRTGHNKSCGCMKQTTAKDWSGIKRDRLTFIRPTDRRNDNCIVWEALCDCGNITLAVPGTAGKDTKSCGCLSTENRIKVGQESRKYSPMISSARIVWKNNLRDGNIGFDEFFRLSQLPCEYCGRPPTITWNISFSNKNVSETQKLYGDFTYNGLDRIDSSQGHILGNVVPCCYPCNMAKGDMTTEEFILHNERQYLHLTERREKLKQLKG